MDPYIYIQLFFLVIGDCYALHLETQCASRCVLRPGGVTKYTWEIHGVFIFIPSSVHIKRHHSMVPFGCVNPLLFAMVSGACFSY